MILYVVEKCEDVITDCQDVKIWREVSITCLKLVYLNLLGETEEILNNFEIVGK
jgi:hypothetical protein